MVNVDQLWGKTVLKDRKEKGDAAHPRKRAGIRVNAVKKCSLLWLMAHSNLQSMFTGIILDLANNQMRWLRKY